MDLESKKNYIIDTLVSYELKVKTLNSLGLFDSAKFFEYISQNLAKVLFETDFINVNYELLTFPSVDLVSTNGKIFIQVSTAQNLYTKVNSTIKKIKNDGKEYEKLLFFHLTNANIDFSRITEAYDNFDSNCIFTIPSIVQRVENNNKVQEVYEILHYIFSDTQSTIKNYSEALEKSKSDITNFIPSDLGEKYHIERPLIIQSVMDNRFVVVTGDPGVGKSVIAKDVVLNKTFLYCRGEDFTNKKEINQIWGFNPFECFEFLGNKEIYIFIDSLEFIADHYMGSTILFFFEKIERYSDVKVVLTCRKGDTSAFAKLINKNNIIQVNVDILSSEEFKICEKKFPILKTIDKNSSLYALLHVPFYLNLYVSDDFVIQDINSALEFRRHIWERIICKNNELRKQTFTSIVFDRARSFLVYAIKSDYDQTTINDLIRDNIIIESNNGVRAKFDIFEDICFEVFFNNEYTRLKKGGDLFFAKIQELGRCVYRRYQIWIDTKLSFIEDDDFLKVVTIDNDFGVWTKQTIIGIIKSPNCNAFLLKYYQNITGNEIIIEDILFHYNLYSYRLSFRIEDQYILTALPYGRSTFSLILLGSSTVENQKLKNAIYNFLSESSKVSKTISDESAHEIIKYLKTEIDFEIAKESRHLSDQLKKLLEIIYTYQPRSNDVVNNIFDELLKVYKDCDNQKQVLAEDIFLHMIDYKNGAFPAANHKKYIEIFTYIIKNNPIKDKHNMFYRDNLNAEYRFGIADIFTHERRLHDNNLFFHKYSIIWLLMTHFWEGLDFIIDILNYSINNNYNNYKDRYYIARIHSKDRFKEFYSNFNLWNAHRNMSTIPDILVLMLRCLEKAIFDQMEDENTEKKIEFANRLKDTIIDKSNNVSLIAILNSIGQKYADIMPLYSLDFVYDLEIVEIDVSRVNYEMTPISDIGRYADWQWKILNKINHQEFRKRSLQKYCTVLQMIGYENEVYKVLDYLYTVLSNTSTSGSSLWMIEKMDKRKAKIEQKEEGELVTFGETISDISKQYLEKTKGEFNKQNSLFHTSNTLLDRLKKDDTIVINEIISQLELIEKHKNNGPLELLLELPYLSLLELLLARKDITKKYLNKYLDVILTKMLASLMPSGQYMTGFDNHEIVFNYFDRIDELNSDVKNKLFLVSILSIVNSDHRTENYTKGLIAYLHKNKILLMQLFYAVVDYSKDTRNEQIYRYENQKVRNAKPYESSLNSVVQSMISGSLVLNLTKMDEYDLNSLLSAFKLPLEIDDNGILTLYEKCLITVYEILADKHNRTSGYSYSDVFKGIYAFKKFSTKILLEVKDSNTIISILIDNLPINKTNHFKMSDIIELIDDVFSGLIPIYFDSYESKEKRLKIYSIISQYENAILKKTQSTDLLPKFVKPLLFAAPSYAGDWSKCSTKFDPSDLEVLTKLFSKYGKYNLEAVLDTISRFKVSLLLPKVLISIKKIFQDIDINQRFEILSNNKAGLLRLVNYSCIYLQDIIKETHEYTEAFEYVLESMVEVLIPEAAVILDEFRIH